MANDKIGMRGRFKERARKEAIARSRHDDKRPAHLYTVWDPRICPDFIDALLGVLSEFGTVKLPVIADDQAKVIPIGLDPRDNSKINKQVSEEETVLIVQCLNIFDNNALYAGRVSGVETIGDEVGKIDDIFMPQMTINNCSNDFLVTCLISLSELIPIPLDVLKQFCVAKSEAIYNQIYFSYPIIIRKRSEKFKLFDRHDPSPFNTISITKTNKSSDKEPRYILIKPIAPNIGKSLSIGLREVLLLKVLYEKRRGLTINTVVNKMNEITTRRGISRNINTNNIYKIKQRVNDKFKANFKKEIVLKLNGSKYKLNAKNLIIDE